MILLEITHEQVVRQQSGRRLEGVGLGESLRVRGQRRLASEELLGCKSWVSQPLPYTIYRIWISALI